MKIYPSLISSDLLNLDKTINQIDNYCDGFHIDVMDDHFVPNLTWGPAFVWAISEKTKLPLHVHLMVDEPEKWLDRVKLKKDDIFIFHVEAVVGWKENKVIDFIKKVTNLRAKAMGCKVGVAINPKTPVESIFSFLPSLDHVLIMAVEPGFSGQKFMPEVLEKVAILKEQRE
ncbi:ribulose-phosphate 3-epimerase, partial [Candidatus Babeliales bacterium]|nr:ribulose-phosphate 3-epimerase [Candidatus Babeliales bacterium]